MMRFDLHGDGRTFEEVKREARCGFEHKRCLALWQCAPGT